MRRPVQLRGTVIAGAHLHRRGAAVARRGRCHRPQRGNTGEEDARGVIATSLKESLSDALAWEGTRLRQRRAPKGRRKETRDAGPNTSSWSALIFLNNIFYD
jgi:hypothetical protein